MRHLTVAVLFVKTRRVSCDFLVGEPLIKPKNYECRVDKCSASADNAFQKYLRSVQWQGLLPEHLKRMHTHTGTLRIRRRPGRDCRDPESMEGEQRHVPVTWVPAIHAGMTLN